MSPYVSPRNNPELNWNKTPKGGYVPVANELITSDAFRALSKTETDLLLYILSKRRFDTGGKYRSKERMDYWNPKNGSKYPITLKGIKEYFNRTAAGMKAKAPVDSTITRAIVKLMAVGFINMEEGDRGGNGPGDVTKYRLTHEWRLWRKCDPPVFVKPKLRKSKGFCMPGSGCFCPVRNLKN